MTVYADVLAAVNLYLDYFLLCCVRRTLELCPRRGRLVLGAAVGGLSSLLVLIPAPRPVILLFSVLTAFLAVAAAFLPLKPFLFFRTAACFWVFSFLLAGFFLFLLAFFPARGLAVLGNAVYFDVSPLFLLISTCGAYAVLALGRRLLPRSRSGGYFQVVVSRGEEVRTLLCKADTGCSLREPFSGMPVLVAEKEAVGALFPELSDAGPIRGKKGVRLVPFHALGGSGVLPAFEPDRAFLKKTGKNFRCYVALYSGKLSAGQFNALLNPRLFPDPAIFHELGGYL